MNKFLSSFMLSVAVCVFNSTHAMEIGHIISVPEEFPGHKASSFQGTVTIADEFDPNNYQQDKHRCEGACNFLSLLAGAMRTEYGRKTIQATIKYQGENYVDIGFYAPKKEILEQYDYPYQRNLGECNDDELVRERNLWEKVLNLSQTTVRVPKKFVVREDQGSFPHDNPKWLNLIQQAYMKITKNEYLIAPFGNGYSNEEEITESDCFNAVPFCKLSLKPYENTPDGFTNLIRCPLPQALTFFPLVDTPLKQVKILLNEEGLKLQEIKDYKATIQLDESTLYTPLTYLNIVDFAHAHSLSKDLLMASNVVQMVTEGHAVALFFGEGKIHYYDNVYYLPQKDIYGVEGPVYEEAKFFKGQDLNAMGEEEFFKRLFQEISYRLKQVTDIRDQETVSETIITFFERPLVDLQR